MLALSVSGAVRRWNLPPPLTPHYRHWFRSAHLSLSPKYKGRLGPQRSGSGVGEGVSVRGRLCTRGRSGQSYAKPPGTATLLSWCRFLSARSGFRGVSFSSVAACCLHALSHLPRVPVPPGVPVYLRVCAGGRVFVCQASSPMATRGCQNLRGIRLRLLENFRDGREGSSPGTRRERCFSPRASSWCPPPSSPALPRRGPALGVAASGAETRARDAAAVAAARSLRRRVLLPARPVGVHGALPARLACPHQLPAAFASSQTAAGKAAGLHSPGLGARRGTEGSHLRPVHY